MIASLRKNHNGPRTWYIKYIVSWFLKSENLQLWKLLRFLLWSFWHLMFMHSFLSSNILWGLMVWMEEVSQGATVISYNCFFSVWMNHVAATCTLHNSCNPFKASSPWASFWNYGNALCFSFVFWVFRVGRGWGWEARVLSGNFWSCV